MKTLRALLEPYKEIRYLPDGQWHNIDETNRDIEIDEQHLFEVKDNILLVRYLYPPSLHWRVRADTNCAEAPGFTGAFVIGHHDRPKKRPAKRTAGHWTPTAPTHRSIP